MKIYSWKDNKLIQLTCPKNEWTCESIIDQWTLMNG